MSIPFPTLRRFAREERAATMVEYAIMVALIAVVAVGAVQLLGATANAKFGQVNGAMQ